MQKNQFFKEKTFRFKRFEKKGYSAYNSMHKAITIGVVSVMTLATSVSKTSNAQTVDSDSIGIYSTLEEVNIKDELSSPLNQAGKVITVITKQEIERLKPQSVAELLSFTGGIDIQTRGAHSVQSDISLRGGNFDQTAVLLNGINISNPHTGHYSLDIPINISDIERIEIIKGPSAIVYGASAFSGGINIVTKKNIDKTLGISFETGEHGFINSEISTAYKYNNIENYLSLGFKNSEGYIANSDYNIYNLLYQNRINFRHSNKLDFQIGYNKKDYGANTFYSAKYPNQYEKTSSFLTSLKGFFNISPKLSIVPSVYYNLHTDKFELIKNQSKPNYHKSNVLGNNMTFSYNYRYSNLKFGSDIRFEEILSSVLGKPSQLYGKHYDHYQNRTNFSYFIQWSYNYKRFNSIIGLMSFQNTLFSQDVLKFYPTININYSINNQWEIFAAFNTSSRLPSFTELYYKDAVHIPNPMLQQEQSASFEIGTKHLNRIFITSINAYYMSGNNMIDWVKYNATDTKWQSLNINKLNKYGIDFDGKLFLGEIFSFLNEATTLQFTYSFIHQKQGKINYISAYALNYLRHKATSQISLPITNKLILNIATKYCVREGSYVEYVNTIKGTRKEFEPFFIMDCNINYHWKHFDVYINCTNVLDKNYFDIGNIPQPGRWLIGGVKYSL